MAGLTYNPVRKIKKYKIKLKQKWKKSKYVLQSKTGGDPSQADNGDNRTTNRDTIRTVGGLGEKTN